MNKPLLVIVGETASGKSELALKLAQRLNGEIVCADSWTVRQGLDIGTAKPSAADRAAVAHHLIDIISPDADFTAAVFKHQANSVISDIQSRNKLPILVGGTGLYIDGVIYDFGFLPAGYPGLREELNLLSIDELIAKAKSSQLSLESIDIRNKRRLMRLIETGGARPSRKALRENCFILGIQVEPEILKKRVEDRVDKMLDQGLEAEVRGLVKRYGWAAEGLKGVGYAQWQGYLDGTQTLDQTRSKIVKATLDLAKRQRTWFKRNKSIHWLNNSYKTTEVVDLVTTHLAIRDI